MVSHFSFSGRIWGEVPCSRAECCNWQTWLKLDHRVVQNSELKKMSPFQFFWVLKYPQEIVCLSFLFSCPVCRSIFQSVCCCLSVTLSLYLSLYRLLDALPISHSIFYVCMFAWRSVSLHVALSVCCSFKMLNIFSHFKWKLFMNPNVLNSNVICNSTSCVKPELKYRTKIHFIVNSVLNCKQLLPCYFW